LGSYEKNTNRVQGNPAERQSHTQLYTKLYTKNNNTENLNLRLVNEGKPENVWAGSLARLGHPLDVRKVTGSNPVRPTKTDKNVNINQKASNLG
jgi:hypothetical protein